MRRSGRRCDNWRRASAPTRVSRIGANFRSHRSADDRPRRSPKRYTSRSAALDRIAQRCGATLGHVEAARCAVQPGGTRCRDGPRPSPSAVARWRRGRDFWSGWAGSAMLEAFFCRPASKPPPKRSRNRALRTRWPLAPRAGCPGRADRRTAGPPPRQALRIRAAAAGGRHRRQRRRDPAPDDLHSRATRRLRSDRSRGSHRRLRESGRRIEGSWRGPAFVSGSEPQLAQSRMIVRGGGPSGQLNLRSAFLDRQVVDAGNAPHHEALVVETPSSRCRRSGTSCPNRRATHRRSGLRFDCRSRPHNFLDQPIVQFPWPICGRGTAGTCLAAYRKLGAICASGCPRCRRGRRGPGHAYSRRPSAHPRFFARRFSRVNGGRGRFWFPSTGTSLIAKQLKSLHPDSLSADKTR